MSITDYINIDPTANWSKKNKEDYKQLKEITRHVIEKGVDLIQGDKNNMNKVVAGFARFGTQEAKNMLVSICKISKDFNYDKLNEAWDYFSRDNRVRTNTSIINLCKQLEIDTTIESDTDATNPIPADVDIKFVELHGFHPCKNGSKTGYYFRSGESHYSRHSNFVIETVAHIISKTDNKRIIRLDNGHKEVLLDVQSRSLVSPEQFTAVCYEQGNFMFWGMKVHLMKILLSINDGFKVCYELKILGWQKAERFFAFNNAIYDPFSNEGEEVKEFNNLGLVSHNDTNYFSPSISDIYKNQRQEDDEYENDRYLTYIKAPINFEQWAVLFNTVYGEHSVYGIGFVFISLFKDVVYKIDNNCPHLSVYGEKGSGKSKLVESISAVFLKDLPPMNLFHATDYALSNRIARFFNAPTWLDEFDDQTLKEERFQAIKAHYEGAGRERGKGTNKNKTEISRTGGTLLLTGQYKSTRDDNAAATRCIDIAVTPNNNRSKAAITSYENLKQVEKAGLSSILIELLKLRPQFEKEYLKTFADTFSTLRKLIIDANAIYEERILRNYSIVLNCYRFFLQHIKLPFSYEYVQQKCMRDVIKVSTLISESNSLAEFWNAVVFLLDQGEITQGKDFKVDERKSISLKVDGGEKQITFPVPTKLLFIRLTTIHPLYLEGQKRQTGRTGINKSSLELYMSSAKSFVGQKSSERFVGSGVTSCYVFDYNLLNVSLERNESEEEEQIEGALDGNVTAHDIAGNVVLKYVIKNSVTYKKGDLDVRKDDKTYCIDKNLQNKPLVESQQRLIIKGILKVEDWKDNSGMKHTKRNMDVSFIKNANQQNDINFSKPDDLPF